MNEEQAREIARFRAKQPAWAEEHIEREVFKNKPCLCSLCYWRRVHVQKIKGKV